VINFTPQISHQRGKLSALWDFKADWKSELFWTLQRRETNPYHCQGSKHGSSSSNQ